MPLIERNNIAYYFVNECFIFRLMPIIYFLLHAFVLTGASSAPRACYEKLNIEAQGFGTCSGQTNLPCARE